MTDRRRVTVQGVVQGVGFRPFVYGLACRLGLKGSVHNATCGVVIDVEGEPASLRTFSQALVQEAPLLAAIERIRIERRPVRGYTRFVIRTSETLGETHLLLISPDVAVCSDCLRELSDRGDRRYRYPFLNCTKCGPRFTIITGVPYDRERTTMAGFTMCPACRVEYEDPCNRRFHAQPTACPACGPRLSVVDLNGQEIVVDDPLVFVAAALLSGRVIALKGLGGYHLACDALNGEAVQELRRRKHREAKPLAIMVADIEEARRYCRIDPVERDLLASPRRPIVLLRKREGAPIAAAVAPKNRDLGVMLPYTPLHHLIMQQVARPLVMTSGNLTDEPIAYQDEDAIARLAGIADYVLRHDRPIQMRCDDSVVRAALGRALPIRRSRGYVPLPVRLKQPVVAPILACGGQMKNVFCLARGDHAFLSQHIGDLDEERSYRAFVNGIEHFRKLLDVQPRVVAHDLHPDYRSTRYALTFEGLPRIAVQHHHAHIAACMAENRCDGPVIGVAFDGTGYGADGAIWGGEFLLADYARFERVAHLEEIPLPGGEQAIRQPWRIAAGCLYRVYGEALERLDLEFIEKLDRQAWPVLRQMLAKGIRTPPTSSAGRLFDAIAALIGLRREVQYEAQAAIEVEMLAGDEPCKESYPYAIDGRPMVVQTRGVIRGVVEDLRKGKAASLIASKFHSTMADIILETCRRIRALASVGRVALSGGVFQNVRLLTETVERLSSDGFLVYTHSLVPPNDGGLALGQAAVADAVLRGMKRSSFNVQGEGRHRLLSYVIRRS